MTEQKELCSFSSRRGDPRAEAPNVSGYVIRGVCF